jgi:hypothetical protein
MAERAMTDTWTVYRTGAQELNESTGNYEPVTTTVYSGPGKLQSFESYERTPEAGAHQYVEMRPTLHLPVNSSSAEVRPDDVAVCTASTVDAELVGTEVTIAGVQSKTYSTARRFPVSEVIA